MVFVQGWVPMINGINMTYFVKIATIQNLMLYYPDK
jgi:hypothetical protein